MRGRLIAIVIVLAVLAFAETRSEDQAPIAQPQSSAASGQLADPPLPEPDGPIIAAAVSTSATFQTILAGEPNRKLRPDLRVSTVSVRLPVVVHSTDKSRFIPLLI